MMYFLWLIFLLFVLMFIRILFFHKEDPIPEQTVIRSKNGKKTYIVLRNR